jgi:integrase
MPAHLQLVEPCNENRKVEPVAAEPTLRRGTNKEARSREYLLPAEIEKLVKAAKGGRWGARDAALITTGFRHGLRAVEIAGLLWSQVEFGRSAKLHVRRAKGGTPSVHPIYGDELRVLTALRKANPDAQYVFTTERGTPFTADGVNKLIKTVGVRAKLAMPIHAHMLRHSCGYKLANDGVDTRAIQAWMGHVSITHTTRYTTLSSTRFADFFRD